MATEIERENKAYRQFADYGRAWAPKDGASATQSGQPTKRRRIPLKGSTKAALPSSGGIRDEKHETIATMYNRATARITLI